MNMMNENGYMLDMRSMAGSSAMQHQQPQITYTHTHHQNMVMYPPTQQVHPHHHIVEHKYPQNIVMQHTVQPQTHHQISYTHHHHPLINLTHQVLQKPELPQVTIVSSLPPKKSRVSKTKSKTGAAKVVKRKASPPPSVSVISSAPMPPPQVEEKPQKKKGRKRKYAQSRQERKDNMYKNLPYINSRNQEVKPKEFDDFDCKCPLKCRKRVSVEARRYEFEAFYSLGSYTAQNVFLLERIKEINKRTKLPKTGKKKAKKKSQKNLKVKNFPKMSSKYKRKIIISSDDDSDVDCKEGIVKEVKSVVKSKKLPKKKSHKAVTAPVPIEDKKCFCDCDNDDCPHKISLINNYDYDKTDSSEIIIESKSFQLPEDAIIIRDDKNNYYHYKDLTVDETRSEYLSSHDHDSLRTSISSDQSNMQSTMSVLQVSCPVSISNNIHLTSSDVHNAISNIQVGQMISTDPEDSSHNHQQITCLTIQPQHIIYTNDPLTYAEHEIIYEHTTDCSDQHIISHLNHTSTIQQDTDVFNEYAIVDAREQDMSKKKRKPFKTERQFTRIYHLKKIRVCREMFVKTLKISSGRVNTVLKKNRSGDGLYRKSGNQGGHNKLTEEQKTGVYNHISSMLQFMTHDPQSPQLNLDNRLQHKSPFPSGFSLKSIYKVYKSSKDITKPVSFTSYSRIFYKEFNPKKSVNAQSTNQIVPNSEKIVILQSLNNQYAPQTITQVTNSVVSKPYRASHVVSNRITQEEPMYANSLPVSTMYTQQIIEPTSNTELIETKPKKKGRKRKYGDLTRQERKYNMYRNLPYVNSRKQPIQPKQFEDYDCHCPLKCKQRVSPKERKREFEGYYNLGSYIAQNMYLLERVEECKKKRCYIKNRPAKRERNFSRVYKLSKVRVCREMFLKTLKISSVRVNTVLNKKRTGEELTYKRGLNQGGMNKITDDQKGAIVEHINGIIESLAMSQQPDSNGDFIFPQEYTFKKMYEIYLETNNNGKCVSFSTYRRVFNEKFNIKNI